MAGMQGPFDAALLRELLREAAPSCAEDCLTVLLHTVVLRAGYRPAAGSTPFLGEWQGKDAYELGYAPTDAVTAATGGSALTIKLVPLECNLLVHCLVKDGEARTHTISSLGRYTMADAPLADADRVFTLDVWDLALQLRGALGLTPAEPAAAAQESPRPGEARAGGRPGAGGGRLDPHLYQHPPPPPSGPGQAPRNPLRVGDDDRAPNLGGPPSAGGGMYVGPDHPMFRERFGEQGGVGGYGGGHGGGFGPQGIPAGSVPPGARFDPIGPGGPLAGPGRGGGRGLLPGGDPDNDMLPPPGYGGGDMFM